MFVPIFQVCKLSPQALVQLHRFTTNFMGHDLAIIVVQNLLFISLYEIDMKVIHLLIMLEHWCCVHCLDTNVICMFVLFRHECCVSIRIVYVWKSCTWFPCLNNAWHLCVNNTNPWHNRFCTNLEQTHEARKFVMLEHGRGDAWCCFHATKDVHKS